MKDENADFSLASPAPWPFDALQASAEPIVGYETSLPAGLRGDVHRHSRAQLVFALAQGIDIRTPPGRRSLRPGEAAWLPGGLEHAISISTPLIFRSIYIRQDIATDFPAAFTTFGLSPFLAQILGRVVDIYAGRADPALRPHLVALILDELAAAIRPQRPALPWPRDRRLWAICRTVLDDPSDRTSLADWSRRLGLGARTIERLFEQEVGMGFSAWRQRSRCLAAATRLERGEPIQRVAWEAGYHSASAFTAMFRKIMGTAPSDLHPPRRVGRLRRG